MYEATLYAGMITLTAGLIVIISTKCSLGG
jgi:hypothetical protein